MDNARGAAKAVLVVNFFYFFFVVLFSFLLLYKFTFNATANTTLFKVLLFGNGIRYLFEILAFEVWRHCTLRYGKNIHP